MGVIKLELQFVINNNILARVDNEKVIKDNRNPIDSTFNFDASWNDYEKFALFRDDKGRQRREYLGKTGSIFSIPVPYDMFKSRYFTVTIYAEGSITTNSVIVYFLEDCVRHYRRGHVHNHKHKHNHFDPNEEKDIFVDIYEQIHSCFDSIEFHEQTLEFFANQELAYSVRLPFADETTVRAWMAEADMKNIQIEQALANKADKIHTHTKEDVTDFDDGVDSNIDSLISDLTDSILNL